MVIGLLGPGLLPQDHGGPHQWSTASPLRRGRSPQPGRCLVDAGPEMNGVMGQRFWKLKFEKSSMLVYQLMNGREEAKHSTAIMNSCCWGAWLNAKYTLLEQKHLTLWWGNFPAFRIQHWWQSGTVVITAASQHQEPGFHSCLGSVCAESARSTFVSVGFLRVLRFSPTVRKTCLGHAKFYLSVLEQVECGGEGIFTVTSLQC